MYVGVSACGIDEVAASLADALSASAGAGQQNARQMASSRDKAYKGYVGNTFHSGPFLSSAGDEVGCGLRAKCTGLRRSGLYWCAVAFAPEAAPNGRIRMLALHVLASGSSGNAAVVENVVTGAGVLIDLSLIHI